MTVRSKLCGIRSETDLAIAVEAGADAVGFICGVTHMSEDALREDQARDLARKVPPYVSTVLVTHLESARDLLGLASFIGVDTIQVHGLVNFDTVAAVFGDAGGRRVTKAIHVTGPEALDEARHYLNVCHALHLDSRTTDRLGGTGKLHDWSISRQIVEMASEHGRPVVLSGGLRPGNVAEAVAAVRPYAVDVNSGIEDDQGDKDPEKARAFVSAARAGLPHDAISS
ncbi:MAG TPA: phosphoribosylanthranilate isomerase [Solirubrobacteraceae bacterium]|nr:phosphoribosylanthranilate isomerase [Solirubrobacteraceae bacterium]